ncbi:MAG: FkbM family methyltransferase [Flavobacteriales bacterium]|nr:FkbM family methyltransferase [Flavobacteriales bacterium]
MPRWTTARVPLPGWCALERFEAQQRFAARSGINYALDLREYVQRNLFLHGDYERNTMRHVRRLIRPGDTVVDIGGNIGFYALEMARLCAPGRLISFEPNPAAIDRFKGNWELNPGITNIQLLEHGLADKLGSFTLSFNRQNLGSASAYGTAPEHIEVRVDTLDNALAARGVERIDVLKSISRAANWPLCAGPKASLATARA